MNEDQRLLEDILKAIASEPDLIQVTRSVDELGVLLNVNCSDKDAGAIIGKQGVTIIAIRNILRVIGLKNNAKVSILVNK